MNVLSGMASMAAAGRVRVCFAIDVTIQPNEFVMVCGSTDALGRWNPVDGLPLAKDPSRPSVPGLFVFYSTS